MTDVELFAGGGGLAVGLHNAGFGPSVYLERDPDACQTLAENANGRRPTVAGVVVECDLAEAKISSTHVTGPIRLLAAGTPCQPFSVAGRHRAHDDGRNLFPHVMRAVRELRPMVVLLENVRGLVRPSLLRYVEYLVLQLEFPFVPCRRHESWGAHFDRLLRHKYSPHGYPTYHVSTAVLDAADYGVPQNRQRFFVVATDTTLLDRFTFPRPTHTREALLWEQADGRYWRRHAIDRRVRAWEGERPLGLAWRTVRDGLAGLDTPARSPEHATISLHWRIAGARTYHGHRGSRLDWPSKTIKAGVHGVPGGENMFRDGTGRLRYYTLREAARLQGFPDAHVFHGNRSSAMRQIGNAVPVGLAEAVARPLLNHIHAALGNTRAEYTRRVERR